MPDDLQQVKRLRAMSRVRPGRLSKERFLLVEIRPPGMDEAVAIQQPDPSTRLQRARAVLDHRHDEQFSDAGGGGASAKDDNPLVAQRRADDIGSRQQPRECDRRRALYVVVEGAQVVTVAIEQASRIATREVFPLQHRIGIDVPHRGHECVDERVILRAAHALMPPAEVEGIGEQLLVVCAGVERDGQRRGWEKFLRRGCTARVCRWESACRQRRDRPGRGCVRRR